MAGGVVELEVWGGQAPVARLFRPSLDIIAVSEIEAALDAGFPVTVTRRAVAGEAFDDRPEKVRGRTKGVAA